LARREIDPVSTSTSVGAARTQQIRPGGIARGGGDKRAVVLCDRGSSQADRSCAATYEQAFAFFEAKRGEERTLGGLKHLRKSAENFPRESGHLCRDCRLALARDWGVRPELLRRVDGQGFRAVPFDPSEDADETRNQSIS